MPIDTNLLIAAYVLQCTIDEIRAIERDAEGALHVYYRGISARITPERADRAARDLTILAANLPRDELIARAQLQPDTPAVPTAESGEPAEQPRPRPHRRARSDE